MTTWTLGIVGLGAAARQIHLPAYARLPAVRVVGGCDSMVHHAGIPFPVYRTIEELLDRARPQILTVATPPANHADAVLAGLDRGCQIFCEKPLTPDLASAARIIRRASAVQRHVVVNQQYRWMRSFAAAKRVIDTEAFGRLWFARFDQRFRRSDHTEAGWRGDDQRRTGQEFGPHVLDLCRFLFGEDPQRITAAMPRPGGLEAPDHLNLIQLEFPGGRAAQITLDRLWQGRTRYLDVELDGDRASVTAQLGGGIGLSVGVRGGSRRPFCEVDFALGGQARLWSGDRCRVLARDPLDVFCAATTRLFDEFLQALDSGNAPPQTAVDHWHTLVLMHAAYESAEQGCPVRPDYALLPEEP